MAIAKRITTECGADACYWRIDAIGLDVRAGTVALALGGYISRAAAVAKCVPLVTRHTMLKMPVSVPVADGDILKTMYQVLAAQLVEGDALAGGEPC